MNKFAGFLGVLAMVAIAPIARADFEILVNGSPCTTTAGSNPLTSGTPTGSLTCLTTTTGTVTITNLSVSGTQIAGLSEQLGSTLTIVNSSASAVNLTIDIADTGFTAPTTPPNIMDVSSATLNVTTGTANMFTLTSCVNQANSLAFCTTPAPGEAPANGTLNNGTAAGSFSNSTNGSITTLNSPFSLIQQLTVVAAGNSDFNITSSQVLTPTGVVPEPAAIVLLGTTVLGVCGLFRRKYFKRA